MLAANKVDDFKGGNRSKRMKPKTGKSESKKLSKSQKLAKSEKKLSKSGNLPNFDAKDHGPSFLTLKAKAAFNRL